MIKISSLTTLITALRTQTAPSSISPEFLGSLLQSMANAMGTGLTVEDLPEIPTTPSTPTPSPGESYDHSTILANISSLQSSVAALSNLIATTPYSGLASWFAGATTSTALMLAVTEKPIYIVTNKFNGKDKPCGILFNFCDDMGSATATPHAMHQFFISNYTDIASAGHDASIHLWHRWFNINAHHGTPATWTAWEQLTFGGGDGCTCVPVTTSANGLMLASDKSKLDRLAISSISLSGNTLTINGNSFILTPVGSGGSTPSGGGDSGGGSTPSGNTSLVYYGSIGTADGSLTASQARSEAHSATLASLLAALHSTSQTTFSDTWNKAAFFIVFPKGKYSSISANATTALGSTTYSLAAGTIVKSTSSSDEYDIYFVTNKAISSSNTASMSVVLS